MIVSKPEPVKIFRSYYSSKHHTFFGYFDVNPISSCQKFILAGRVNSDNSSSMEVGFYNLEIDNDNFVSFGRTETWCWQMGCRLQWFPNMDRTVIYNSLVDGEYGSIIQKMEGGIIHKQKYPIYVINSKGDKFCSLNFSRLERLRPGYGYHIISDKTLNQNEPEDDGIFIGNFGSDNLNLCGSVKEIANINRVESMDDAMHYVNHLSFSPESNLIFFLHLWVDKKQKKNCRAMIYNQENNSIKELIKPEYAPSHFCWVDNNNLIFTTNSGPQGRGYYHLSLEKDNMVSIESLNEQVDGHPTYVKEYNTIISDTIPDKFSDSHLFGYNLETTKKTMIGSFYSPLIGKNRCDLHPRVTQKYICVDSAHKGQRGIFVLANPFSRLN